MKALESTSQDVNQYLTFLLNNEEYGLELLRIQEIRGYTAATPIPSVRPYVRGVINLRGTVLPVVDLRIQFGIPSVEYNKFTVIVITNVGAKMVGLLVDAVSDVLEVNAESMQPPPDFGSSGNIQFIQGVFPTKEGLAVVLDLEKLLDADALSCQPGQLN